MDQGHCSPKEVREIREYFARLQAHFEEQHARKLRRGKTYLDLSQPREEQNVTTQQEF
jgi:hypothetical protein